MPVPQKALIVRTGPAGHDGLDALNDELRRGWQVVHVTSMGGAAVGAADGPPALAVAALVVLERAPEQPDEAALAAEALGEALDDTDSAVDEVVEEALGEQDPMTG
jgi:hypothetical protein